MHQQLVVVSKPFDKMPVVISSPSVGVTWWFVLSFKNALYLQSIALVVNTS